MGEGVDMDESMEEVSMCVKTPVHQYHHEASRTVEMTSERTLTPVEQKSKAFDEQAAIKEPYFG